LELPVSVLVAPPPARRPVARPADRTLTRTTLTDAASSFAAALVNRLVADGVPFSRAADIGADYVLLSAGWPLSMSRCARLADAIEASVAGAEA
jgi:hypothetical protein